MASEYAQCGGENYVGPKECIKGIYCYIKDKFYSQCLQNCPANWLCQCKFIFKLDFIYLNIINK